MICTNKDATHFLLLPETKYIFLSKSTDGFQKRLHLSVVPVRTKIEGPSKYYVSKKGGWVLPNAKAFYSFAKC